MTEQEEQAYSEGNRAAWLHIYAEAARMLGYDGLPEARLAIEREQAVAALRILCRDHGDNDWPDDLHLRDVIDKHLGKHLYD